MRLVDGYTPLQGRVEMCSGGIWGRIFVFNYYNFFYYQFWDAMDVKVVCRQLGYPWQCEFVNIYIINANI